MQVNPLACKRVKKCQPMVSAESHQEQGGRASWVILGDSRRSDDTWGPLAPHLQRALLFTNHFRAGSSNDSQGRLCKEMKADRKLRLREGE